ncbi:zf-C2H2 Zinc finger, C2H2 type [Phlyctochytrium planicorne]|nr:zf-C2H2 Zinc finger, C2H2 type [Phlyctochytrium planicorne]
MNNPNPSYSTNLPSPATSEPGLQYSSPNRLQTNSAVQLMPCSIPPVTPPGMGLPIQMIPASGQYFLQQPLWNGETSTPIPTPAPVMTMPTLDYFTSPQPQWSMISSQQMPKRTQTQTFGDLLLSTTMPMIHSGFPPADMGLALPMSTSPTSLPNQAILPPGLLVPPLNSTNNFNMMPTFMPPPTPASASVSPAIPTPLPVLKDFSPADQLSFLKMLEKGGAPSISDINNNNNTFIPTPKRKSVSEMPAISDEAYSNKRTRFSPAASPSTSPASTPVTSPVLKGETSIATPATASTSTARPIAKSSLPPMLFHLPNRKRASVYCPYICPFDDCHRTFTRKSHLISHVLTHTNAKVNVCPHCTSAFARLHDLQRHIKTAHVPKGQFKCEKCGAECTRKDSLVKHLKLHCKGE